MASRLGRRARQSARYREDQRGRQCSLFRGSRTPILYDHLGFVARSVESVSSRFTPWLGRKEEYLQYLKARRRVSSPMGMVVWGAAVLAVLHTWHLASRFQGHRQDWRKHIVLQCSKIGVYGALQGC